MNISLRLPQGDVDLDITAAADATIGDLIDGLVADGWLDATNRDAVVRVDGGAAPPEHSLVEVGCGDGAVVEVGANADPAGDTRRTHAFHAQGAVRLGVAGGLDAGRWIEVAAGRHRIGRGPDALLGHVTTSDRHATLDVEASGRVTVVDHGSRNGTWINGVPVSRNGHVASGALVRTGALLTRVVDRPEADRARMDTRAFNRPPRPGICALPGSVRVPTTSTSAAERPTVPIASVLGGLAMGTVMYVMTGTMLYALMAFMAPIMAMGGAIAGRRRHGREQRTRAADHRRSMGVFVQRLQEVSDAASARQRALHPDLAEVVRRATDPSIRLWERRLADGDAHHLVVGHATCAWQPTLERQGPLSDEIAEAVRANAWLREVPIVAPGGVVGVVGDRSAALGVARSLLAQACVHHGPADLEAILVTPDFLAWDGAKWLPHLCDPATGRPRAADPVDGRSMLDELLSRRRRQASQQEGAGNAGPVLLVVLDGVETCEGRDAPGRAVLRGLAGEVLGIVVAPSVDQLPSSCDTVVVMEGVDGACRVTHPARAEVVPGVLASGISEGTLAAVARGMARFDDPESASARDLPATVALPELFDASPTSADHVRSQWAKQRAEGRLRAPIGMAADGPLVIDLAADGPHALVAGTTGAGKSELLRSLVAGLAANADPDHVAFVLVDYKGGAAFDRCADLPHVAGVVTDLDDDLAERALVCLQAELHRRELLLRTQSVGDLDAYRRTDAAVSEPLPDLVVVIDEFATMAAELPDFLDALVGIAQRGRSLGVHLVLATQRPSGVVSDDIRANTNLRIALRVQDRQDSTDVIEDGIAATLTRDQPGRGFVRLGPGHLVGMQSALVTGSARAAGSGALAIRPFGLVGAAVPDAKDTGAGAATDLDLMVSAICSAFDAEGLRRPREPWPEALPSRLTHEELQELHRLATAGSGGVVDAASPETVRVGLVDDPRRQRRRLAGWNPADGSLLIVGAMGAGATSTLHAVVTGAARRWSPKELHVHALDAGRGDLAPLEALPHVSSVVRLGDDERVQRLVSTLAREVEARRQGAAASDRRIVLAIDDWEAIATAHEAGAAVQVMDDLIRVVVDGPAVGVLTVMTVGRPGGVHSRVLSCIGQRWVMRLPDDADGASLGIGRGVARLPPGRVIDATTEERMQIAITDHLEACVAEIAGCHPAHATQGPTPIGRLPLRLDASDLRPSTCASGPWRLPVGTGGDQLDEVALELHVGEHALVIGPARSGRSTVLRTLGAGALAAGARVVVVAGRPGATLGLPGADDVDVAQLQATLVASGGEDRPTLVLVDDAELVQADGLDAVLSSVGPTVRLVAAARADAVRTSYGHWTRAVARSRVGLLLSPDTELDGDLFGVRFPRRPVAPAAPGRGWIAQAGVLQQCQPAADLRAGNRVGASG